MIRTLDEVDGDSRAVAERHDCVPRALALAFDIPYNAARLLCAQAGRPHRGRMSADAWMALANELAGHDLNWLPGRGTVRTFGAKHSQGTYLVRVRGHVLVFRAGQALDWTAGRLHRIKTYARIA